MTPPEQPPRVGAAIDIGSNSVHLLVGAIGNDSVTPLHDESELLGLGDALDRTGHLAPDARVRLTETLLRYVAAARAHGAAGVTIVGTEPLRRTVDRELVRRDVLLATGIRLQVLRHEDEALLTLLGVTGGEPPRHPLLVVDIGGGSSEYVLAGPGTAPVAGGIPTGSARLSAAIVKHDPPTSSEIRSLRAEAARLIEPAPAGAPDAGVMVGGTATNLSKLASDGLAGARLAGADLPGLYATIEAMSGDEIAARYLVNRRRAGMLAGGAAIVEAFMDRYGLDAVTVSLASLREGAIIACARGGDGWLAGLSDLAVRGR